MLKMLGKLLKTDKRQKNKILGCLGPSPDLLNQKTEAGSGHQYFFFLNVGNSVAKPGFRTIELDNKTSKCYFRMIRI